MSKAETNTGFVSRFVALDTLTDYVKSNLDNKMNGMLSVSTTSPCIISSWTFADGLLSTVGSYLLDDVIADVVLSGYEAISDDDNYIQATDTIASALKKIETRLAALEAKPVALAAKPSTRRRRKTEEESTIAEEAK